MNKTLLQEGLQKIVTTIELVYDSKPQQISFLEIHSLIHKLSLLHFGQQIYDIIRDLVEEKSKETINSFEKLTDENLLSSLDKNYQIFKKQVTLVQNLFSSLESRFIKFTKLQPLYFVSMNFWVKEFLVKEKLLTRIVQVLIDNISLERQDIPVDQILMKNTINMLLEVSEKPRELYQKLFEEPFLTSSKTYFHYLSQEMLNDLTCANYLQKTIEIIRNETDRVTKYLYRSTKLKIEKIIQEVMIKNQLGRIKTMRSSPVEMFQKANIPDLKVFYFLFEQINQLDWIFGLFRDWVNQCIVDITSIPNKISPINFVKNIFNYHLKVNKILNEAFKNNTRMRKHFDTVFLEKIHENQELPKMLPQYIDFMLKKDFESNNGEEIIQESITIFKLIQDKDIFRRYYELYFARRLLRKGKNGFNEHYEKLIISKLKLNAWPLFTKKLEDMMTDIDLSEDINNDFKNYFDTHNLISIGIQTSLTILKNSVWPATPKITPKIPQDFTELQQEITKFYNHKHTGRVLMWQYQLCSCEISARFHRKSYTLVTTLFQAIALQKFEKKDKILFQEMHELTDIPEKQLQIALRQLSDKDCRIIGRRKIKQQGSHKVTQDLSKCPYCVNTKFKHKTHKINLIRSTKSMKVEFEEKAKVKVQDDRKIVVDAAIVKIMKFRKSLIHNNLITEVINILSSRFKPSISFIKKRIDTLIDREYLARDENNHKKYLYLA
ncbi:cullin [Anaeramoeba flamelloides]|uniref:Cullin n=1 Tax=Anaeramoeba flamelloides TaxID=1746091 RepID=A0ABQ8Z396_9EUKA|nr:cullin [Anaeramoeba flamelloides]